MLGRTMRVALVRSASMAAIAACIGSATISFAQDSTSPDATAEPAPETDLNTIVVTGIRASLDRSIELKRNNVGVVDGISAEEIGKFPDTNLAESLQRISGVSIDRVNGEGSRVTVRGFGPGYNLVTLNGRTLPTASIASVGQDQNGDFVSGTTRSFDFNNLASEGVNRLEVYKTARAAIPSGGIGAAINIVTRRPLDGESGFTGSIGAKAAYDKGETFDYDKVTPEVSGIINWANPDDTFGVGLFASYQKRNNAAVSESANDWNITTFGAFSAANSPYVNSATVINNPPASADTFVAIPNDTRYHYSEFQRERINGQLTLQFRPSDVVEITADGTFYQNDASEQRGDQTTWYNRPFNEVTFDDNQQVATAIFLDDIISNPKDGGFEQQYRATRDRLWDAGLNAKFTPNDRLTILVDGHYGEAKAEPNNPRGNTSTLFAMAYKGVADQTMTIVDGFPQQGVTFSDNPNGNANGVLDLPDLGTQVARSVTSRQSQSVGEARVDGIYEMGDDDRVSFGASYRETDMSQSRIDTYNALGDWGVGNIGDIAATAPDLVQQYCLTCKFTDFNPGATGVSTVAFRGDATKLFDAFVNNPVVNGFQDNSVREKIWAVYGQFEVNSDLGDMPINITGGVRYEHTDSRSTSVTIAPSAIDWTADNDFVQVLDFANGQPVTTSGENSYDHILPALDFSIDLTPDLKGRVSYGKTIARPDFGSLFASQAPGAPNRPTALGGVPGGTLGNPNLVPLVSDNFDVSLEWYFAPSSYFSAGFFDKRVKNFVGVGQTTTELFGLRDPSSGADGTRSGAAYNYLANNGYDLSDVNLFTLTALIDQVGLATAVQQFQANLVTDPQTGRAALSQAYIDQILAAYDVSAEGSDPLYQFQVTQPVNNKEGHIYGLEIAGQYFFGDSGFGVSGAYTLVRGDVGYDITAPTTADQFALLGLSDTANVSGIFEKFGLSARVTYNWRAEFLSNNSRGSSRNPVFVAPYDQFDANVSYDVTDMLSVSFEAINITGSNVRTYARTTNEPWFIYDGRPRYYLGARIRF